MTSTFDTCYTLSTLAFSDFFLFCFFVSCFSFPTHSIIFSLPLTWCVRIYGRWHRLARVTTAMGEKKGNGWSNIWERKMA